jgi:hypothetical protein
VWSLPGTGCCPGAGTGGERRAVSRVRRFLPCIQCHWAKDVGPARNRGPGPGAGGPGPGAEAVGRGPGAEGRGPWAVHPGPLGWGCGPCSRGARGRWRWCVALPTALSARKTFESVLDGGSRAQEGPRSKPSAKPSQAKSQAKPSAKSEGWGRGLWLGQGGPSWYSVRLGCRTGVHSYEVRPHD